LIGKIMKKGHLTLSDTKIGLIYKIKRLFVS